MITKLILCLKREVNDVAFNLPRNKGMGTFIWEPISWGETVFNKDGKQMHALMYILSLQMITI